jgi:hypothetical protein
MLELYGVTGARREILMTLAHQAREAPLVGSARDESRAVIERLADEMR